MGEHLPSLPASSYLYPPPCFLFAPIPSRLAVDVVNGSSTSSPALNSAAALASAPDDGEEAKRAELEAYFENLFLNNLHQVGLVAQWEKRKVDGGRARAVDGNGQRP